MPYWAALDGLRGLAVLGVLLFHAQLPQARGGFLGVDIFFVLSGFLITTQLVGEARCTGHVRMDRFFLRRAMRLQPALLLLLAVYLGWWALGLIPGAGTLAATDVALVLIALTHWARAFDWNAPDFLGHAWSLGIEEQFYILWALVFWLFGSRAAAKPRAFFVFAVTAALASTAWMWWLQRHGASPSRLYNGLDTRAMALLSGCALAGWFCAYHPNAFESPRHAPSPLESIESKKWGRVGSVTLAGLVVAMGSLNWTHPLMFPWGYAAISLLATMLIASVVNAPAQGVSVLLTWQPLVALGKVSYGLYLWHYPILRIAEAQSVTAGYPLGPSLAAAIVASVLIAFASYRWVEQPLRYTFVTRRNQRS